MKLHNQYEVIAKIGQGALGAIYKARDVYLGELVAIKQLRLDATSSLRREAQVLSVLRHENIVGFRQLFPEGEHWYMVMDYVNGGSLAEWIDSGEIYGCNRYSTYAKSDHSVSRQRISAVAIQSAEGLSYAHSKGIIHQDVKPDNILIAASGVAKVSDFGLARGCPAVDPGVSDDDHNRNIRVTTGGMTQAYCSPEQSRREKLTDRTDVWSWGLSILEIFSGGLTWRHGTAAPVALNQYLLAGVADPALPAMPLELAELLKLCFQELPQQRPSMTDVLQALIHLDSTKLHHPELIRISIANTREEKAAVARAIVAGQRFAKVNNGTLIDTETNLMWSDHSTPEMTFQQAQEFVQQFSGCGYRDWTLPTVQQLHNLSPKDLIFPDCITLAPGMRNWLWTKPSVPVHDASSKSNVEIFSTDTFTTYPRDPSSHREASVLAVRSAIKEIDATTQIQRPSPKSKNWLKRLFE